MSNLDNPTPKNQSHLESRSSSSLLKKLVIGIGITLLAFLLIVTFGNFNAFDESLSPEVSEGLKPVTMPTDENNALIAIWGLTAANDRNITHAGRALIERYRSNRDSKNQDQLFNSDYQEILGGDQLDNHWQSKLIKCHARRNNDCIAQLAAQLKAQPIISERLNVMLERYRAITSMSEYQNFDEHSFATPLPTFGALIDLSKIQLANALNSQNSDDILAQLISDQGFWRRLLSQGDTIMDKMISVAGYWSNLHATSNFLSTKPTLADYQVVQLRKLLIPLSPSEMDISEAFVFEEKAFYRTLHSLDAEQLQQAFGLASKPIDWLIQPNATINDYHQFFVKKIEYLGSLPTQQFAAAINHQNDGHCCFQEIESLSSWSFSALYNLGGKSLLSATLFNAQDYLARVHDLNGLIGLVDLKLSLLQDEPTALQKMTTNDSVLGHKLIFDEAQGTLEFKCLDASSLCKVEI